MTDIPAKRRQLVAPWLGLKEGSRALNPGEGVLGLGLFTLGVMGGGGVFNPTSLFSSGEKGFIINPAGVGAAFQETTGASATTPSGNGEVAGSVKDYSPNNAWMTASSAGVRPTLNQSGDLWYLLPDGTDDLLETALLSISSADLYCAVAFRPGSATTYERLVSCAAPGATDTDGFTHIAPILRNGTSTTWESYRSADRAGGTVPAATETVIESGNSATGSYFSVNGAADTTTSYTAGANFSISRIRLFTSAGNSPSAAEFSRARLYGAILMDRLPSSTERAAIVTWLGALAGLSLP